MKLSDKIATIAPSVTLKITAKAKAMKAEGLDVIGFGAGEPDFDTPQYIKDAAVAALAEGKTKYTPASGLPEFKKAIVRKLSAENGIEYGTDQIVVSCGAKHSLFNVFQALLNPGDEVIVLAPYWLSYPEMVVLAGGTPVFIETRQSDGFKATPQQFKSVITPRTRAVIINSPSNPTGAVYSESELRALAAVCVANNIIMVSDEIYEHLLYDGKKHVSIASFGQDVKEHTVTVNGLSKSYAMTGWRLGYLAAPAVLAKAVGTLQSHSTSNPTSFAQFGGIAALEGGLDGVKKMVTIFENRRNLMIDTLSDIPGLEPFTPQGAFYVFCDISGTGLKALDFASRLLEEAHVAVVPGDPFGCPSYIRLSFATGEAAIMEGLARIKSWLDR